MSKLIDCDEQEALKLDEFFKKTLASVRPYVLGLTSTEDAQLCRAWLDKLNGISKQRKLRNEYLIELCKQLKTGRIKGVFGKPPPNGLLVPFPRSYHTICLSSSLSELSDSVVAPYRTCAASNAKCAQRDAQSKPPSRRRCGGSANTNQCSHSVRTVPMVRFYDELGAEASQLQIYKRRIDGLTALVEELQIENEHLNHKLLQSQDAGSARELTAEVASLKSKLVDAQRTKEILETNHKEILQLYKSIAAEQIAKLKQRLNDCQSRNQVLENNARALTQRMEEVARGKEEEIRAVEKQWADDLETVRREHKALLDEKDRELQSTQESLVRTREKLSRKESEWSREVEECASKIRELQTELEKKTTDEGNLQTMITEQYARMKEEFNKMRHETDLAWQAQNQGLVSKIVALKKAVERLERSKERLRYNFEKRLFHIAKSKDVEMRTLQLRLEGQRSELCTSMSSEKQSELDGLVGSLEDRYRVLLAASDATLENQRQEYLAKITELEEQLSGLKKILENGGSRR